MSFFVCCRVFCFIVGHCYISLLSSSIHTFIFCLCYLLCKFFSKFLTANCNNLISFDVLQQKWSMVPNLCIWILFLLSNNQHMKTSFSYVHTDPFLFLEYVRHYVLEFNLVWSRKLSFLVTHISRCTQGVLSMFTYLGEARYTIFIVSTLLHDCYCAILRIILMILQSISEWDHRYTLL